MPRYNYIRKGIVSVDEILDLTSTKHQSNNVIIHGVEVSLENKRIRSFKAHGISCVNCGIKGMYFAVEKCWAEKRDVWHLNLYALTFKLHEVLMTRDHVIPLSKGGSNKIENSQTMCTYCNSKKGNRLTFNQGVQVGQTKNGDGLTFLGDGDGSDEVVIETKTPEAIVPEVPAQPVAEVVPVQAATTSEVPNGL